MRILSFVAVSMLLLVLGLAGCQRATQPANTNAEHKHGDKKHADKDDAKIKAALAKLSPENRKLAEEQMMCPISGDRLGSMGTPIKIMLKGQPVMLCCDGCQKDAKANPDKTLAKVKELREAKAQK